MNRHFHPPLRSTKSRHHGRRKISSSDRQGEPSMSRTYRQEISLAAFEPPVDRDDESDGHCRNTRRNGSDISRSKHATLRSLRSHTDVYAAASCVSQGTIDLSILVPVVDSIAVAGESRRESTIECVGASRGKW